MAAPMVRDERGIALVLVLLLSLAVAAIGIAAVLLSSNASLTSRYAQRLGLMEAAADGGVELGRSQVNGNRALYPDSNFTTLENGAPVTDAGGSVIPGLTRSTYVGPTGVTSGQYGVFGAVVSVVQDAQGNRVVRRTEVVQESFAKFAYFTDVEPSNIYFAPGDQFSGPVHSNDVLKMYGPTVRFLGRVTTARTITNKPAAVFQQGYQENAGVINLPTPADLLKLSTQASAGNARITGTTLGSWGQATTRVEFVAIDLNADGDATDDNEGFFRVYQVTTTTNIGWLMGLLPADYAANRMRNAVNCGHYHGTTFIDAASHPTSGPDAWTAALSSVSKRCYLGGSDSLTGSFVATDARGRWLTFPGTVSSLVSGRPDGAYLFPISRALNPGFKGVVFVDGNVAVSGTVRGQVTLAATGNIIIVDDVRYATDPGAAACGPDKDILGAFAGTDVIVSDNTLNAPLQPTTAANWFTYDDTQDEFVHAVLLPLNNFTAQNYSAGATRAEPCGTQLWGRGCLYVTGGIIQRTRGAVGTTAGTGYIKRYAYDLCAGEYPPPYFPTTGRFARGRYFDVDPANFDIAAYFRFLTAGL